MNLDLSPHPTPFRQAPSAYDLRGLSTASSLRAWWRAEDGVQLSPTMSAIAGAPAVTLTGNLRKTSGLIIKCYSATTYRWSLNNGWTWQGGSALLNTIPNGGSVVLGDVTAHFAAGTYSSLHEYRAVCQSWTDIVGGHVLDNSTVVATTGPYVETPTNERPNLRFQPDKIASYLGNQDGLAFANFAGPNKKFRVYTHARLTQTNISSQPVALWSATSSNPATAYKTADYQYCLAYGDAVTNRYVLQRREIGGAVIQASFPITLDFSDHIFEDEYDPPYLRHWIDGFLIGEVVVAASTLTVDRLLLGAAKPGSGPVAMQPYMCVTSVAIFDTSHSNPEADAVRRRLAWAA